MLLDYKKCNKVNELKDLVQMVIHRIDYLKDKLEHIGHIQISSFPQRQEPDNHNPDYKTLLPELISLGYTGWFGCEYVATGHVEDGLDYLNWFTG